jgi:hypothetical protein
MPEMTWSLDPPDLSSQVARITGVGHQHPAASCNFSSSPTLSFPKQNRRNQLPCHVTAP